MPSAGLGPATPALGRRRSGPLSYEGMLSAARQGEVIIDIRRSGRSSARLECSVRDREVGSSNLLAPTYIHSNRFVVPAFIWDIVSPPFKQSAAPLSTIDGGLP